MILFIADSKGRLLDKIVKESNKKELTINLKKTKCVVSIRNSTKCQLHIRDVKIKQMLKSNYLATVITMERVTHKFRVV